MALTISSAKVLPARLIASSSSWRRALRRVALGRRGQILGLVGPRDPRQTGPSRDRLAGPPAGGVLDASRNAAVRASRRTARDALEPSACRNTGSSLGTISLPGEPCLPQGRRSPCPCGPPARRDPTRVALPASSPPARTTRGTGHRLLDLRRVARGVAAVWRAIAPRCITPPERPRVDGRAGGPRRLARRRWTFRRTSSPPRRRLRLARPSQSQVDAPTAPPNRPSRRSGSSRRRALAEGLAAPGHALHGRVDLLVGV